MCLIGCWTGCKNITNGEEVSLRIPRGDKLAKFAPLLLMAIIGWNPLANAASSKLVLTGASTIAPLASEIARRFELEHPGTRIDVQSGGSSRGINDTRNGTAAIGMVSRDLKPEERDLHAHTIAWDGVGIILHASNPVTALSRQQIVDIYTGKISNWKMVGGKDAAITVVNKADGRSTLELFLNYLKLKSSEIKPHVIIGDNSQGIKIVAGNANAIGYVSIGAAEYEAKHGLPIKLLPLDGVEATVANVRNGTFPLSRPLNLITREPNGLAQKFIEFARSIQVHDLVEAQYFVPPGIR
jgi:phosphate transport system substrate-binding protein